MKKSSLSLIFVISLFLPNISFAEEFVEKAKVLNSSPVVEKLYAPGRGCSHSAYKSSRESSSRSEYGQDASSILGIILGGAAGSTIGKGSGRGAATALGAILGNKVATGGDFSGEEVLGALAGGVAGNAIGKGKPVVTASGALFGAALGAGMVSRERRDISKQCGSKVASRNVITSYDVEYEYQGFSFQGNLPYRPDEYIDIIISVDVLEDRTQR